MARSPARAFTFVAVVTRQVVSRRSAAGQVRLVLRAVKSRRLDLVSCSREGREPETRVTGATGGLRYRKISRPFFASPSQVYHNYGPPSTTRAPTTFSRLPRPYLFQFVGYARPVIAIKSRDIRDSISRSPARLSRSTDIRSARLARVS